VILENSVQLFAEFNVPSRTKAVAFADDLIPAIRDKRLSEAANVTNIEMSKITTWGKAKK
jgi:hypothetical protein